MLIYKTVLLRNGTECVLRTATGADAEAFLNYMKTAAAETDHLSSLPSEITQTVGEEAAYLELAADSSDTLQLCAECEGRIVGGGSLTPVLKRLKTSHRAEIGIAVEKSSWNQGIGTAVMETLIRNAKKAGYRNLELEVAETNLTARKLYGSFGFGEYGKNSRGFRLPDGTYVPLILMILEL